MTIASVQDKSGIANNTTSISITPDSNVTAGDLIVFMVANYQNSAHTWVAGDCTKTAGTATIDTIQLDKEIDASMGNGAERAAAGIWSCLVTGTGSLTLQVANAPSGSYLLGTVSEYSGTFDSSRLEASASNSDTTDSVTSGNTGSGTSAGAALFSGCLSLDSTTGTAITENGADTLIFEDEASTDYNGSFTRRIVGSGTTASLSWTFVNTNHGYSGVLAVYKETGGGGGSVFNPYFYRMIGGLSV